MSHDDTKGEFGENDEILQPFKGETNLNKLWFAKGVCLGDTKDDPWPPWPPPCKLSEVDQGWLENIEDKWTSLNISTFSRQISR